tara:strand:- start:682 stop:1071 length:390 start_codon:yes stop_codon:yes gene_type:complete
VKLLLDTHVFIWAAAEPARLPGTLRTAIEAAENEVFLSAASVWEIAIKQALGRISFPLDELASLLQTMEIVELPIAMAHGIAAGALPRLHDDPFDRMLIAQAQCENLQLATVDAAVRRYDVVLFGAKSA